MAITKKLYDSKFKNERILRQSRLEMRNRYDSFYRTIDGRAAQLRAGAKRGFANGSDGCEKENASFTGGVTMSWWAVRGSNPRPWD